MTSELTPPRPLPKPFARIKPDATWVGKKGVLWSFDVAPHVICSMATGHVSAEHARQLRDHGEAVFARAEKVWAVHDWQGMTSYDSGARTVMTEWAVRQRGHLVGCVILTGNAIVAMGVTAASLPMQFAGVSLEGFSDRVAFERRAVEVFQMGGR